MTLEDRIRQRRLAELQAQRMACDRRLWLGTLGLFLQTSAMAGVAAAAIWLLS